MICPHCNQYFEHATEDLRLRGKFMEAQQLVRARHDSKVLQRFSGWSTRSADAAKAEAAARQHPRP